MHPSTQIQTVSNSSAIWRPKTHFASPTVCLRPENRLQRKTQRHDAFCLPADQRGKDGASLSTRRKGTRRRLLQRRRGLHLLRGSLSPPSAGLAAPRLRRHFPPPLSLSRLEVGVRGTEGTEITAARSTPLLMASCCCADAPPVADMDLLPRHGCRLALRLLRRRGYQRQRRRRGRRCGQHGLDTTGSGAPAAAAACSVGSAFACAVGESDFLGALPFNRWMRLQFGSSPLKIASAMCSKLTLQ